MPPNTEGSEELHDDTANDTGQQPEGDQQAEETVKDAGAAIADTVESATTAVADAAGDATSTMQQAATNVVAAAQQAGENIAAATATATASAAQATVQAAQVTVQAAQATAQVAQQATKQAQASLQQAGQRATVSPSRAVYRGRRFAVGFSLSMMVLAFMAAMAKRYNVLPGDVGIARRIQKFDAKPVDALMQLISEMGWQIPSVISRSTFAAVMWAAGFRMEGAATASTFSADIVTVLIKSMVNRPRPTPNLVRRTHNLGETSFPSGHVVHYVTFYGFLFYLFFTHLKNGRGRNALLSLLAMLVLLVGPSRVYMGAHWPSDVAAAYLVGSLWLSVEIIAYLEFKSRFQMLGSWPFLSKRSKPIQ